MIRPAVPKDAENIASIYNYYVANTVASFEEEPITGKEMARRIKEKPPHLPWLVYEQDGEVAGYAYANRWKARAAYRYAVESTIYLNQACAGKGIGTALYAELIAQLRLAGCHCVLAGISLPNEASIALHEKFGFQKIAHFKQVGFKFGRWVDVGYWQLLLTDAAASPLQ